MKRLLLWTISALILSFQAHAYAAIAASDQEQNAVKVVKSIFRLETVRDYLFIFKSLDLVSVDVNESIAVIDQTRQELVAALPTLTRPDAAFGSASNAAFAVGLVVTDLKSLEAELKKKNKLTPAIQNRLSDVYDFYKELSE